MYMSKQTSGMYSDVNTVLKSTCLDLWTPHDRKAQRELGEISYK